MKTELFSHRRAIEEQQLQRLNQLLLRIGECNPFYRNKLQQSGIRVPCSSLEEFFHRMPFTTKQEIVEDQLQHPLYGTILSEPLENYVRFHQTSGTTSRPLRWLDTRESWGWVVNNWKIIYEAVE